MRLQGELKRDEALWLLGSLCGLLSIPFDASLIAQNYPPPYTLLTLHEAARALGDPLSSPLGSKRQSPGLGWILAGWKRKMTLH